MSDQYSDVTVNTLKMTFDDFVAHKNTINGINLISYKYYNLA